MTQNIGGLSADVILATYNYASSPTAGGTDVTPDVNGNIHSWLYVGDFSELDIDVTVTMTGTTPTLTLNVDRALAGAQTPSQAQFASNVAQQTAVPAGPSTVSFSIGGGLATTKGFGRWVRVTWGTFGGTVTTLNLVVSVVGKAA